MKVFLQSAAMATVLFLYGYILSTAGHDHSAHQHKSEQVATETGQSEHHHNDSGHDRH